MLLKLAFGILGILWIIRKYKNYFRSILLAFRLPGPPALPILGNVLILKDSKGFFAEANNIPKRNAPLVRIWIFCMPYIWIYEPDHLKIILSNSKLSDKNSLYRYMQHFFGDGLLTSTGARWSKHRKLIQPYFKINLLEKYFDYFIEASEEMLGHLSGQRYIQITRIVNTCVANILHRTILGVNLKTDIDESPFGRSELQILQKILKPWLLWDTTFKHSKTSKYELEQFNENFRYVKKILNKRLSQGNSENNMNTCLLDRLIELSETSDFSEEDILNETVTFMTTGQDTVSATLVFCLYHLAKHQDIQEKVYKEISEIVPEDLKAIRVEQVNMMHYLEQCIKETLRLIPVASIFFRELSADITLGNYTIPSGTNILISPFVTHRLPHNFSDPLRFDPDRFSKENIKKIHPYGFIPFSMGPRTCIAYKFAYLEIKTITAFLIKNYHIALQPGREDLSINFRAILGAKGGVCLNIRPRQIISTH